MKSARSATFDLSISNLQALTACLAGLCCSLCRRSPGRAYPDFGSLTISRTMQPTPGRSWGMAGGAMFWSHAGQSGDPYRRCVKGKGTSYHC